ncbi:MAG: hypothetical protein JST48_05020 [Bacteroidetes bacterium]|nr:hypothetical protein [Bacteroidota bacterium]
MNISDYRKQIAGCKFIFVGICLIVAFLSSIHLSAQITQPARYEREQKNSDHEFIVVSMNENGLALVRDTEKFEGDERKWDVVFLDTALHEVWQATLYVELRMNILGHEYRDGNIYLIFQQPESNGREVNLAEINPTTRSVKQHTFKPGVNIRFTHFSVMKDKAIFGGYLTNEPALLMYDLATENNKIIPGIVEPNLELMDVRTNTNNTFNAVLVEGRSNKSKKLIVRTYDAEGVMLLEDKVKVEEGKTIIEAITSTLVREELLITGTWTYGTSRQPAGVFSLLVDPFNEQTINYYDFASLNHFLDYLKPKKIKRIKAKAQYRKDVGRPTEFRSGFSGIKIEETQTGFSFLGETYDIDNNSSRYGSSYNYYPGNYSPYGFYPYSFYTMPSRYYMPYANPYNNNNSYYRTTEVHAINASLIFFDVHGKLESDLSLKFPEIKLPNKEQVSDFFADKEKTILLCKDKKEILLKYSDADGTPTKEDRFEPTLSQENEVIKSETQDNSGIRKWYGNYFYVYGYQTLRNVVKKHSRDVFYVNKIKVN